MNKTSLLYLFFLCISLPEEGRATLPFPTEETREKNEEIALAKRMLQEKYAQASSVSVENQELLLEEIRAYKAHIYALEEEWRKQFAAQGVFQEEGCGMWDAGEMTLSQLIMEYGSTDYLYIIPPEIMNIKLQIFSGIPIPRASWNDMVKLVLQSNGIGVKALSPHAKKLYILKQHLSMVEALCDCRESLELLPSGSRIAYVFTPAAEQIKALHHFFTRFSDPKETAVQIVASKIVLVSSKENVEKLLRLYDAVWEKNTEKVVRVVSMQKIDIPAAEQILKAFFPDPGYKGKIPLSSHLSSELVFLSIPQGLVLIGNQDTIHRAENVLYDLENQLEDPYEMTVYWYSCKHSNPEDVADVLSQVYDSLLHTDSSKQPSSPSKKVTREKKFPFSGSTQKILAQKTTLPSAPLDGNFIVDPKTGAILMVIRKDQIAKIKALLQKIDVPKKMVQIDVLLVEKKMQDQEKAGINLLKIGTNIVNNEAMVRFDGTKKGGGILDFVFSSKTGSKVPGIDLSYNFLLTQKDLKINANPSVLAVNQTPALISIVEELSINNGAVLLDSSSSTPRSETSFTRAQYGTVLKMTPTIHYSGEVGDTGFITLVTDITFDTTRTSADNRPPVTKRSIKNEVTVADGETIILGGLRQINEERSEEKIPFLGDIPGLGKLFGTSSFTQYNTEMFIFITPKIVKHPIEDLRRIREQELQKRAGDLPEFLAKISEAKKREKKKMLADSLDFLFSKAV